MIKILRKLIFFVPTFSVRFFLIIILPAITLVSYAGEGFNHDETLLPAKVREVWNSVFLFTSVHDGGIGSAVLVSKKDLPNNQYELTFLTSGHLVVENCGYEIGICDNIQLTTSKSIDMRNDNEVTLDQKNTTIIGARIVRRLINPDLALLKATVQGQQFSRLKPVPITKDCSMLQTDQQVFVIGHPVVFDRNPFEIPYKHLTLKRWSSGHLVANTISKNRLDGSVEYGTGSTADSLKGSSGGATVNLAGELIGIHAGSLGEYKLGKPYSGDETTTPKIHHASFVRCEYLANFVNLRAVSIDPKDYYKKPRSSSTYQSNIEKSFSK